MLKRISCFFLMFWAFVFTFSAVVYADEYEDHLNEWMKQFNPDTGSTENNPEKDFPVPYAESTEVEPNNNNRFTCPSININDIVTGYLQEKGDIDCLKFEATKDTKIVVTLDNVPLGYTHALWLQDANGNPLASATSKNEVCHTISYNVTKGNTYIICCLWTWQCFKFYAVQAFINRSASSYNYSFSRLDKTRKNELVLVGL